MSQKNIPAFPVWSRDGFGNMIAISEGMTLRDYFAGQALTALGSRDGYSDSSYLAIDAYKIADAMLEERAKENK